MQYIAKCSKQQTNIVLFKTYPPQSNNRIKSFNIKVRAYVSARLNHATRYEKKSPNPRGKLYFNDYNKQMVDMSIDIQLSYITEL